MYMKSQRVSLSLSLFLFDVCVAARGGPARRRQRLHQKQLPAARRCVPPAAAHHRHPAGQQLPAEAESQTGVEAVQEAQVRHLQSEFNAIGLKLHINTYIRSCAV